jgi:hypothetical protein
VPPLPRLIAVARNRQPKAWRDEAISYGLVVSLRGVGWCGGAGTPWQSLGLKDRTSRMVVTSAATVRDCHSLLRSLRDDTLKGGAAMTV